MSELSLAKLKPGELALIIKYNDKLVGDKLIEMGCLPGEQVSLSKTAPLGCPIAIKISGYELSLRKEEAEFVIVELVP